MRQIEVLLSDELNDFVETNLAEAHAQRAAGGKS